MQTAKDKIMDIATKILKSEDYELRVGFVAYR